MALAVAALVLALALDPACPPDTVPWPEEACEPVKDATQRSTTFLRNNMFPFDRPNEQTLFDDGIIVPTVSLALKARQMYGWAARVPSAIFQQAVLPYASVNEARTDWRQLMWDTLSTSGAPWLSKLSNASTIETVAMTLNAELWTALGKLTGKASIEFRGEQTPLIYDPLSTILFGYASCTGISLTLVDALRTIGVPARLVGTPAWHGKAEDGNHNWVEVWLGAEQGWAFFEGAPAGAGETLTNPCDKWFCNPGHFAWVSGAGTEVFAANFDAPGGATYPMAWDPSNAGVAGVNRTSYYVSVCNQCR